MRTIRNHDHRNGSADLVVQIVSEANAANGHDRARGPNGQIVSRAELPDGTVPAFARMLANNPEVFGAAMGQFSTVMFGGSIDVGLKQLAFVTVSQVNDSPYCAATHGQHLVEALGYPMDNLEALASRDDSEFTEEQRAVAEFARQAAIDPKRVSDKHITGLRQVGFDNADIVETLEIVPADENPDLTRYYPKSD